MRRTHHRMPRSRTDDLAVEELLDETLVYDGTSTKAHSLNRTATLVWRHCDGRTTVATTARRLAHELGVPADEALVWMTLRRLSEARLLEDPVTVPAASRRHTRREALRAIGLGAALPVIVSLVLPRAAHAASCDPNCAGRPDCSPCDNCNKKCCAGICVSNGQAKKDCGC